MYQQYGDIFKPTSSVQAICITTNGNIKSNGRAVMGAGIAKTARDLLPDIDLTLGQLLRKGLHTTIISKYIVNKVVVNVVAFPTKYHWKENSSYDLIKKSAEELAVLADHHNWKTVWLPKPGCNNGHLDWDKVEKILSDVLDSRFTIIKRL